jgi:GT2 family glycosyltransferase
MVVRTLSIVIVNWNTRTLLSNLLASVFEHAPRTEFEVIVVDNASTDHSQEMVSEDFPGVTLLVNGSNEGFASAVNRGIRESSGRYVLLLNTDLIVCAGAIDAQLAFMEANPRTAICGGLLLNDGGNPDNAYGRFPSVRSILAEVLPHRVGKPNRISIDPAVEQTHAMTVDFVSGADLMARRTALDAFGLLDEKFFMYFEDADWCLRATKVGWDVFYVPWVCYSHKGLGSMIGLSHQRQQVLTGIGVFLRKHYHGAEFAAAWLLWQLLRVKAVIRYRSFRILTTASTG